MWNVIGHEKNKKYFETVLKNGGLSHAYIFSGPEMIGKKKFAEDLYKLINRRDELKDSDMDIRLIFPKLAEDETKIYIEDIRTIKAFLSLKPVVGPYKFVIIDDAHRLTPESSNALLKVLEEPPPSSILVLVTSAPSLLPQTIISRCQPVNFLPDKRAAATFISSKKLRKSDDEFLMKMANGRIGWASRLIESEKINEAIKLSSDLSNLLKEGIFERLIYAKKLFEAKSYPVAVDYWIEWLHSSLQERFPIKNGVVLKELLKLRNIISQPQFNHRLALENFLINL